MDRALLSVAVQQQRSRRKNLVVRVIEDWVNSVVSVPMHDFSIRARREFCTDPLPHNGNLYQLLATNEKSIPPTRGSTHDPNLLPHRRGSPFKDGALHESTSQLAANCAPAPAKCSSMRCHSVQLIASCVFAAAASVGARGAGVTTR